MPLFEKFLTKDNSYTLFLPEYRVYYHSIHGACSESKHVFINQGLLYYIDRHRHQTNPLHIHLLELGFGTGLNAVLTAEILEKYSQEHISVHYHAIDHTPITTNVLDLAHPYAAAVIDSPWNSALSIHNNMNLTKHQADWQLWNPVCNFDLVYLDFFAPDHDEKLWQFDSLSKIYRWLNPGGVLTTFCAQGRFRRTLQSLGFEVETLPGPPGKRHMTRGTKAH